MWTISRPSRKPDVLLGSKANLNESVSVIRTLLMLGFWAVLLPLAALVCFPWTLLTGNVNFLYRVGMWGAWTGVRLAGIRVQVIGLDKLDPALTYIFMSNHA